MFDTSGKPKMAKRFWPRLFNTALNKMRLGHRKEQYPSSVSVSITANEDAQKDSQEIMANAVSRELNEIVFAAMRRLNPRHRALLTLRCYREMKFSHIAESLQCSEFAAKVHFYRAKRNLQRQLSRHGLGRGMLLTALVLFGKITAPSEAAAKTLAISAATTKVSVAAGLAALATTKTAILSLTAAGAITLGTIAATSEPDKTTPGSQLARPVAAAAKGVQEYWHFFPRSTNGPVMMRLLRWDTRAKRSYCQWLQNERANYYFDKDKNTIFIRNHRSWHDDLAVWRLPTDNPNMQKSLSRAEDRTDAMQYVRSDGTGLLVILKTDENTNHSRITHHNNIPDEHYFLYDWPSSAGMIDTRDTMHKRGWTYFRITGQIDGEKVAGTGRIPFVYATSKWYYPWLKITVGDRLKLVDTGAEARLYDASGGLLARYQGGSFFKGLARPWMGLHTIDTVRRDAAAERISFETAYTSGRDTAQVKLNSGQTKLTYTIDMQKDVVKTITISTNDDRRGVLRFTYIQDIDETTKEFVSPRQESPPKWQRDRLGILWLTKLMHTRG